MEQNKKIKVLQVAGRMDIGGIENQLMHLIRNADKSRFQIDFTTTDEHPFFEDEIISLGGSCIHIPGTNSRQLLRYCRSLYHVLKDGKYDIVHSHELFHSGLVVLTARLAGVKHRFVHAHSSNQQLGKSFARRAYTAVMRWLILRLGTEFFACSSLAGEFLYGKKMLKKPNYHLVVNSVETARFLPDKNAAAKRAEPDGRKTVLQVGRFQDEKNFLFTTRIAAECRQRGARIRFQFVGNDGSDNPYELAVRRSIKENELGDTVQLLGVRKDVNELMKQADAFILPSKYEGMPLTLIEAQAAGLPCVAADSFSHEVDLGLDQLQWLKLSDPISAWADAVETAAARDRLPRDRVEAAVREKGFDVKCFSDQLCSLYQAAVRGERSRP